MKTKKSNLFPVLAGSITLVLTSVLSASAQETAYPEPPKMVPAMTEFWTPQPKIVTPGDMDRLIPAPSDAIVLFDGKDLSQWQHTNSGEAAKWEVADGAFTVSARTGDIQTKRDFEDFQLHIEWRSPTEIKGTSQGRGNSGVLLQGKYELQVLDNYENETYINGQAGSIYKQSPPLVNPIQKPGKWNTYDVIYTAPRFKADGTLQSHGRVTVLFNGVLVQNNTLILGTTEYIGLPRMEAHGRGPIRLQDHGNPVSYRNIWIREL